MNKTFPLWVRSLLNLCVTCMVSLVMLFPVQASTVVGAIQGQFQVIGGTATYSVPIFAPKGRADMAPRISLDYNSQAGEGTLEAVHDLNFP